MRSQNTFRGLCAEFLRSTKFKSLAPASQALWARELEFACRTRLGDIPLEAVKPSLIQGYLDGWDDKPGKQAAALTAFKALEKWANVRDFLSRQITLGVETGKPQGSHVPWTEEQVRIAEDNARNDIARAITLGANTGQRASDLVRMGWTDIETHNGQDFIEVTQQKTGRKISIPTFGALQAAILSWERRPGPFLLTQWGTPWDRKALTHAWTYERDNNPNLRPLRDAGLVLHGLRGHACVRLYRAGCTTRQVADMVGMSEPMVARYTRLSSNRENNLATVHQLEEHRGNKAVKIGDGSV